MRDKGYGDLYLIDAAGLADQTVAFADAELLGVRCAVLAKVETEAAMAPVGALRGQAKDVLARMLSRQAT